MKMRKVLVAISTAILVVILALAFAGCDNSGKIKKAYEKAGYEVTVVKADKDSEVYKLLDEEQRKDIGKYSIITCKKDLLNSAIIVKYPSESVMKDILGEEIYNKAVEAGLVNGSFYLSLPVGTDVIEIFKNA